MNLSVWPPPPGYLCEDKSYIIVTWDELFTDTTRGERFQSFVNSATNFEMWNFHLPNHTSGSYGALFSCTDTKLYLSEVKRLKEIGLRERLPFSNISYKSGGLMEGDLEDRPEAPVAVQSNHVSSEGGGLKKKKKEQAYLAEPTKKKKYTKTQRDKFNKEREATRAEGERNKKIFETRLATEPEFAKNVEAQKESKKEKRKMLQQKKKDSKKVSMMFGLVFGEERRERYGDKGRLHQRICESNYMSIGHGKFFHVPTHTLKEKKDFYEYNEDTGEYVRKNACDVLNGGQFIFARYEVLPEYERYEYWHRGLPLHVDLISEEDKKDIVSMAPKSGQPCYPFVYVYWVGDDDESSDASHQFDVPGSDSGSEESCAPENGEKCSGSNSESDSGDDDIANARRASIRKKKKKMIENDSDDDSSDEDIVNARRASILKKKKIFEDDSSDDEANARWASIMKKKKKMFEDYSGDDSSVMVKKIFEDDSDDS